MFHSSVLLNESVCGLNIKPNGVYVDVTFGGGGHSNLILSKLSGGKLFAFDQDRDAHINTLQQKGFKLIHANFRYIRNFLRMDGITKIDGLLADLGVSSYQFDTSERGFSTRLNGDLDMRMDAHSNLTAKEVVNCYSEENLSDIFFNYGELRNSRVIAGRIVSYRQQKEIVTTFDLKNILSDLVPTRYMNKFLARVFQAIRIEVNDEIGSLKEMLLSAQDLLAAEGRLVVLSYHSIEDRLVKNLMKRGNFQGQVQKDFFGNPKKIFRQISKKALVASSSEIRHNPRARSVRLRIAEKINDN